MVPRPLTAAVLFLSLPALSAQTPADLFNGGSVSIGGEHLAARPGAFGRTQTGDLTGDLRPDLVVALGARPAVGIAPGAYSAWVDLPADGNDFCVVAGGAPAGHDSLALVGERGLEHFWLVPGGGFGSVALGSAAWIDAAAVRSADVDGSGEPDLVGLSADRQTLVRLLDPTTARSERTLAVPGTILAFTLANWDGGADVELAALSTAGVFVLDHQGALLFAAPGSASSGVLVALPDDGAGRDRLACVVPGASGDLLVVRDAGGAEPPLDLGNLGVVGLAAGDLDQDGRPDLVLSHRSGEDLLVLWNRGAAGATFGLGPGDYEILPIDDSGPATGNLAWPSVADFDLDGDLDVIQPVEDARAVQLARNGLRSEQAAACALVGGRYDYDEPSRTGTLTLTVAPPVDLDFTPDAVEVVHWRQGTPDADTDRSALARQVVGCAGLSTVDLVLAVGDAIEDFAMQDVEVRFVATDGAGTVLRASATRVFAVATRISAMAYFLQVQGLAGTTTLSLPLNGYTYQGGQVSDIGVGVAPMGEVPDFTDGDLPDPWA